jgi:CheY-like chemotaxis protein
MNTTVAALLFGIAVLIVVAILLWRAGDRGTGAKVSLSFGQLFEAQITLDQKNASSAENAVRKAADERGEVVTASPVRTTSTRLARLLWVDDNPDNNLYETVALEQLGRFITKTTSTEAAMRYLDELPISLIITDVGRGNDPRAGEELIRRIRAAGRTLPIVVYTLGAAAQRDQLRGLGADAVVDMPDELIREVNTRLGAH